MAISTRDSLHRLYLLRLLVLLLNQSMGLHSSLTDNSLSFKYITVLFTTFYQASSWDANSMRLTQSVSNRLGRISGVSPTHQNEETINFNIVRKHLVFQMMSTPFTRLQSFRFSSVGTIKNRSLFSFNLKRSDTSLVHFWCPSNHSGPLRDHFGTTEMERQSMIRYVKLMLSGGCFEYL